MEHKFEFRIYPQTLRCSECGIEDAVLLRCTHAGCRKDVCVVCAWGCFLSLVPEAHPHELQVVRSPGGLCQDCGTTQHYALFCAQCCADVVCVPCHAGHQDTFTQQCSVGHKLGHKLGVAQCSVHVGSAPL
jgi:hypothetical protein